MRRAPLARSFVALALAGCGGDAPPPRPEAAPTLLADENARPGDSGWAIDDEGSDAAFGAYARPLSVRAGDRVDVMAAAGSPQTVTWAVYRLGWYAGTGGRKLTDGSALIGPQPPPFVDASTGLVECRWPSSLSFTVGDDWPSGLYVARLASPLGGARYAPFVVRDDRPAAVAAVLPTATAQSYNAWGGESLYVDTMFHFPIGHGYQVSYDRPFLDGAGGGSLIASVLPAIQFLEANGYDVTYLADHDVAHEPSPLLRAKLAMALAHDEYWTRSMRDHYEQARDAGVDLAFLGANTGYWQIRLDAAPDGMPDRRQTGYKEAADLDPLRHVDDADVTASFRSPILGRPENALLGIMSSDWHTIDFPWVVRGSSSWVYAGVGVGDGDLIPGLVGVESDKIIDNGLTPSGIVVLADSPTIGGDAGGLNKQQATVYPTAAGGFVFAAGSIRFPATLGGVRGQVKAQQLMRNLIVRAGGVPLTDGNTVRAHDGFAAADLSRAAAAVTTLAGSPGAPGFADGPASAARFDSPMGLAIAADGALIVVDAGNRRIRRVGTDPGRTVTTLAGDGTVGDDDGRPGRFRTPYAALATPDGAVLVSDPKGKRIRRVAPDGTVSTVASGLPAPAGLARTADGTLYVSDLLDGQVRTVSGSGAAALVMPQATPEGGFGTVTGLLGDGASVLVIDSGKRMLRRLDGGGALVRLAGNSDGGFADGDGNAARMWPVLGLARVGGSLVFADTGNYRLRVVDPGTDAPSTTVRTLAGVPSLSHADGDGAHAGFVLPTGVAWDASRNVLYVADTGNSTIRELHF